VFGRLKLKLFGRRYIKGDVVSADTELLNKQYNGSWSIPSQYQGEEIVCSKCNKTFTFSAKQKKQYYEGGGNIYAKIHMCPECHSKPHA
jgi:hypothetical protein